MIIIKSQSRKTITQYDSIVRAGCTIKANRITVNAFNFVAEYKSEERAKKVMVMIEDHINNQLWNKIYGNDLPIEHTMEKFVFTMPKE